MSFQIECPNCSVRPVWEFHYGGPVKSRPQPDDESDKWSAYIYNKPNTRGVQTEWWYHRSACKLWFVAERDTQSNQIVSTRRYAQESSSV